MAGLVPIANLPINSMIGRCGGLIESKCRILCFDIAHRNSYLDNNATDSCPQKTFTTASILCSRAFETAYLVGKYRR